MIALDVLQGSPEWHAARLGLPTASQFDRILTPKTRKLAAGADGYMHELLAEWLTGEAMGPESRLFIERGTGLEASAVAWYEFQKDIETDAVGVCLRDDGRVACSPDRLIADDGGLEIKCPSATVHVANMLTMGEKHYAQVQGGMWITGRSWWDLVSYHPEMPSAIVHVTRDDEFIGALAEAVDVFLCRLDEAKERLLAIGCRPRAEAGAVLAEQGADF